jgi:uncharacterized protein (DUF433 family)
MDIVAATNAGLRPEDLSEYFSSRTLTLSEIYAALSFYYDHQEEIDAALAEDLELGSKAKGDPAQTRL